MTVSIIEKGPVRVTVWYGAHYNRFGGFVEYIRGLGTSTNYKYFNDFSWFASWDIDHFALRMQAIFRAPETGTYTFGLIADDFAELHIYDCPTCSGYSVRAKATAATCFSCIVQ